MTEDTPALITPASTRPTLSISLLSFAFTVILAIGGAAVTVYTSQATHAARIGSVEQRVERVEQKAVTREELTAQLKSLEAQLQSIQTDIRELRSSLNK